MFKRLFGRRRSELQNTPAALHMPEVKVLPHIEYVFDDARKAAAGEGSQPDQSHRYVVIVTPERRLLLCPCPSPGSMSKELVAGIEQTFSPGVKNIAVISFNEINDPTDLANINVVIPFFGLLVAIAYTGHPVWVFEGHPSALAAGCRDADVLIVDGGMKPFLQDDWLDVASGVMRNDAVYVHDRTTFSLQLVPAVRRQSNDTGHAAKEDKGHGDERGDAAGIAKDVNTSKPLTADSPYLMVYIKESGEITLDGKEAALDLVEMAFSALAQKNGVILYARDVMLHTRGSVAEYEPHPNALKIIDLAAQCRLPVRLCNDKDFLDAIGPDGKLRVEK